MGADLKRLSHRHMAVMNWMLANPDRPLRECAEALNYTQAWVSMVVHSDLFQTKMQEYQNITLGETTLSLKDKLTGIAHAALENLAEQMEVVKNPDFVLKSTELILKATGYVGGPKVQVNDNRTFQQTNQQNNFVSAEVLRAAEQKRHLLREITIDVQVEKKNDLEIMRAVPNEIRGDDENSKPSDPTISLGETSGEPAAIQHRTDALTAPTGGSEV